MAKISKPVLYLAIVAVGVAIYVLTTPDKPVAHTPLPKTHLRTTSANGTYTQADYDTTFAEPVLVSRDSFKPLVARKSNALAVALAAAGGIPADLAGGDPNWVCTGTTEVDGVRQALLENRNTSAADFVKQGDKWKTSVVSQVLDDGVVLVGNDGQPKTIHIQQDATQTETDNTPDALPVRPQLNGVIGSGVQQPTTAGAQVVPTLPAPDPNSQMGNNNAG